jgi:hypothetical protein
VKTTFEERTFVFLPAWDATFPTELLTGLPVGDFFSVTFFAIFFVCAIRLRYHPASEALKMASNRMQEKWSASYPCCIG